MVSNFKEIRAHTVSLIRGEVGDENLKKVEMDKYKSASKLLEDNLKNSLAARYSFPGAVLKAAQDIVQRKQIYRTSVEQSCQVPCQAGRLTAVITETGDVYPCESFQDKLGNLRASGYDLPQILGNEKSREVKKNIKKNRCYCTHECNMMMNILFNPGQYPALLREYARLQAGTSRLYSSTDPLPEKTV
jgi:radical SAM protein with 4Fe4S-binding SPASM domain